LPVSPSLTILKPEYRIASRCPFRRTELPFRAERNRVLPF
jgi:hypothetical protein